MDEGQADVGPDRSAFDLSGLRVGTSELYERIAQAFNAPRSLVEVDPELAERRRQARARFAAVGQQFGEALRLSYTPGFLKLQHQLSAARQVAVTLAASRTRIPHAPRHPRKGDFDWLTGKPLQGRRYRQACRSYNRQVRYRRIAQRELGGS